MQLSSDGFPTIGIEDDPVVVYEALHHSIRAWEDIQPDDMGHTSRAQDGMGLIGDAFGLLPIPDFEDELTKEGPATIFVSPEELALCLGAYRRAIIDGQVELGEDTAPGVIFSIEDDLAALKTLGVSAEGETS